MNLFPFLTGAVPAAVYFLLNPDSAFSIRLIDSLFLGGLLPFIIGSFRWICSVGSFDLFIYSNKRIWGRKKTSDELTEMTGQEKENYERAQGSFLDYLQKKGPSKPSAPYLLTGVLYLAAALLLTWVWS